MNWLPRGSVEEVSPPFTMPRLIWNWLQVRGLKSDSDIKNFLSPSLLDMAHPFKLKDMDLATERLVKAFNNQETICVYGDYDLDGSSGIALLCDGLQQLGFKNVFHYQPSRFLEGYGIHKEALEIIFQKGASVVVSVDCGITAIEEAQKAKELGLDLIITDHHLPRGDKLEDLPQCVAVINPNRNDCESGLGYLSGVGVGFYLLLGLKTALSSQSLQPKSLLDLFSIGTITDLVPLKKENRVLVKHGLKTLVETQRPGLRALLQSLEYNGRESIDSQEVAFNIAPKLNALSRLELGIRPLDIFMCESDSEAQVLIEQVLKLNSLRKKLQEELEVAVLAQLPSTDQKNVIVLGAQGHPGVVGLVATKVTELTGAPAFIVAWKDGEGTGSARGLEKDCLPKALQKAAKYLDAYGGHAQAAGFSLSFENFENFKKIIEEHYEKSGSSEDQESIKEIHYDVEAKLTDFDEAFMNWLKHAGPFGSDNPTPLFRLKDVRVSKVQWLKDLHLKLTLQENRRSFEALAFFAKSQYEVSPGDNIDLLVEPSWNYWRGQKRLQFLIRSLHN